MLLLVGTRFWSLSGAISPASEPFSSANTLSEPDSGGEGHLMNGLGPRWMAQVFCDLVLVTQVMAFL